jgi:hypothetical protein
VSQILGEKESPGRVLEVLKRTRNFREWSTWQDAEVFIPKRVFLLM